MTTTAALNLDVKQASDDQLHEALCQIGSYKLNLRRRFVIGEILFELREANEALEEIVAEMIRRQPLVGRVRFARDRLERDPTRGVVGQHQTQIRHPQC